MKIFSSILLFSLNLLAVDGKVEALQNLDNSDPVMRRSSLLLLSKFSDQEAMVAVIKGLYDQNELVRYTALTSLNEYFMTESAQITTLLKSMNVKADNPVINQLFTMLSDSYLGTRRLASSVVIKFSRYVGIQVGRLPKEVQVKILNSFKDPDALVRYNMFSNYIYMTRLVPNSILLEGIRDEDTKVKDKAIEMLVSYQRKSAIQQVEVLLNTTNELNRAFVMSRLYSSFDQQKGSKFLKTLVDDQNAKVSGYAFYALSRFKEDQGLTAAELDAVLLKLIPVDLKLGSRIISSISRQPSFKVWFKTKCSEKRYPFYEVIVKQYIMNYPAEFTTDELLECVGSSAQELSNSARYALAKRTLTLDQLLPLAESSYTHTRQGLIYLSNKLSLRTDKEELLSTLILDDDPLIQYQAFSRYVHSRYTDYLLFCEGGLEEEQNPNVVTTAVEVLIRNERYLLKRLKEDKEFELLFKKRYRPQSRRLRASTSLRQFLQKTP